MAKQTFYPIWEKTIGFISFYKRCGVGCVRMKSNLTGKRWRTDPLFAGSRRSAACLALAAKLASPFYKSMPQRLRCYSHYKQLVGVAQRMLYKGYTIPQVNKELDFVVCSYLRKLQATDPNRKPIRSPFAATLSLNAKTAFTTICQNQMAVPVFTAPTAGKPANRQQSITIMPPRGSPFSITGCIRKIGNLYQLVPPACIPQANPLKQPSQMAGLFTPIPTGLIA